MPTARVIRAARVIAGVRRNDRTASLSSERIASIGLRAHAQSDQLPIPKSQLPSTEAIGGWELKVGSRLAPRYRGAGFDRYALDAASSLIGVTLSGSIRTIR